MKFLVFDTETIANMCMVEINDAYGCPVVLPDGYKMTRWDKVIETTEGDGECGFYKPQDMVNRKSEDIMKKVSMEFQEHPELPKDYNPFPDPVYPTSKQGGTESTANADGGGNSGAGN